MLSNESTKDAGAAQEPYQGALQPSSEVGAEQTGQVLTQTDAAPIEATLEVTLAFLEASTAAPQVNDFQKILEILAFQSFYKDQLMLSEEFKKERRLKLFNTRTFFCRDLIQIKEDGTKNYEDLIEHIKFLEEIIKDLKSCHQAADLARIEMINQASASERAAIAESDKKYAPKFKEREKIEAEKMTAQEKQIKKFVAMGLTREAAEKIIFAK